MTTGANRKQAGDCAFALSQLSSMRGDNNMTFSSKPQNYFDMFEDVCVNLITYLLLRKFINLFY